MLTISLFVVALLSAMLPVVALNSLIYTYRPPKKAQQVNPEGTRTKFQEAATM